MKSFKKFTCVRTHTHSYFFILYFLNIGPGLERWTKSSEVVDVIFDVLLCQSSKAEGGGSHREKQEKRESEGQRKGGFALLIL